MYVLGIYSPKRTKYLEMSPSRISLLIKIIPSANSGKTQLETHPGFMFYSNDDVHWWFHRKHHSRVWKKRNSQQYHNNILYRYKLIKCHSIFVHPNNFCVKFDTLLTNCKYWEFFRVQITVGLHLGAQAIYLFGDRRKLYLKVHFAFHWYLELLRTQDSGRPKNLPFLRGQKSLSHTLSK